MKSVLIGIVAAVAIAFAAHAAYNNFVAGNNTSKNQATQTAAQPASTAAGTELQNSAETADLVTAAADESAAPSAWQGSAAPTLAAADRPTDRPTTSTNRPARVAANNQAKQQAATANEVILEEEEKAEEKEEAKPEETKKTTPAQVAATTTTDTTAARQTETVADSFSNPGSVAEYDFAFVDPQFANMPLEDISGAKEQAEQNVLSPSAP